MRDKIIGIGILAVIVAAALLYQFAFKGPQAVTLKGYVGGEKMAFLEDEEVRKILKKRYGIHLDYAKAGSIEMVKGEIKEDVDYLWPSSQVALELFKLTRPGNMVKSEIIFNSPIVLYSWEMVTEALTKLGIVKKIDESYYIVDFPKMVGLILDNKKWSDIGLPELYGRVQIISTDPSKSNSGNMYSGLLANIIYGDVVSEQTLDRVLPKVKDVFLKLGYMEHSSSDLFEQYLRTGIGAKPVIAGYENQIIEFSLAYKNLWPRVKDKMRILYPVPTVWSSHPLIIIKPRAKPLIQALQDKDVQRIAWEKHGFRTGLIGVQNDPKVLKCKSIPESITKVIPMPSPAVMDRIIESIQSH